MKKSAQDILKEAQESFKGVGKTPVVKAVATKKQETSSKPAETPTVEKVEKTEGQNKESPWKNNGGARTGSGRKELEKDEQRKTIKRHWEEFADEEIEVTVTETHKGSREQRKVKMARLRVAQERLFAKVKDGDVAAIREFNDRVGGKAPQTLRGGDMDDTPIQVDIGFDRMIDKIYGNEKDE